MGACSSGGDSDAGSAGSSAQAGSADAGRGGDVATARGGAGSGGARVGSGGAEAAYGGSIEGGVGSGGRAGSTGGAVGSSGAGAGGAASSGGAGGAASSGGAGGVKSSGGAGGAKSSGGAGGAASSGGAGGTASSSGAGGAASSGGAGGSGPKCSTPTVIANNAVARDANGEGLVTETDVCVPELGVISSITLKYKLTKFFGDPARQAVFAYYAGFRISNAFWVAQVMTTSGEPVMVNGKLVYVSWLEGSWPPPGGTFGTDSTGSPWWYETFSYYSGGMTRDGYVDETNAKAIYAAGFTLDRLRMVKVNGSAVLY